MALFKKFAVSPRTVGILTLVVVLFGFGIGRAFLSTGDNTTGWLWSSDIGWVKQNNCTDPRTSSTCTGSDFGASFLPIWPGTGSGYVWSSTLGWITLNDTGCPTTDVPGCTGGTSIDWNNPNPNDTVNVKGWARVCSVFASGCSGTLADNALRGGWDGFIALSSAGTGAPFGVTLNPSTGQFNGFGWGSDVVGWLDFSGATLPPVQTETPTVTLIANPSEVDPGGSSLLVLSAQNFATNVVCTIDQDIGTVVMNSVGRDAWEGTVVASDINADTIYTASCTGPSGSATDTARVTVRDTTPPDDGGGGDGPGGPGDGGPGDGGPGGPGGPGDTTGKDLIYQEL